MTAAVDWAPLIARVLAGERAADVAREVGVDGRSLNMRSNHARPEFAAARDARIMRATRRLEMYSLRAAMSDGERADYDTWKRVARLPRNEALRAIGRADLVSA